MYLNKVFIKHPNICVVPKNKLVCVFPFLGKKSLEIKKRLQNAIERTKILQIKSFLNDHLKLSTIFILKMCIQKNSAMASFIVLSVIAATQNNGKIKRRIYVKTAEHMGISHLTSKRLQMLSNQLFQITC